MKKDLLITILRLHAAGLSNRQIGSQLGLAKSTIQGHLSKLAKRGISAASLDNEATDDVLDLAMGAKASLAAPDYEAVYAAHHCRGKKHRTLKELWQNYKDSLPAAETAIAYKGFCKGYNRFCKELPASLRDLSLTNHWNPGDVAMIDYSGDGMFLTDHMTGAKTKVDIFVAVLANSGYIFCYATHGQTRADWLDAQVKMMEFFGGSPMQIFLDNSTSLVTKADRYNPKICRDYESFCDCYSTVPVAVRPGEPKDKALVENAVQQCQRSIIRVLAGRTFFNLESLNAAIAQELEKLNSRPLTSRSNGISRRDLFEDEKPFLQPLPALGYELSMVRKILKVQKDYLVRFENRRYSVPSLYVGHKVLVVIRKHAGILEVFDIATGERIAKHYLTISDGTSTRILPDHMPANHRAVLQSREQLMHSISVCGPSAAKMASMVGTMIGSERTRKLLRGMDGLRQRLGNALFEECCAKTLERPSPGYEKLLETADILLNEPPMRRVRVSAHTEIRIPAKHKNYRGPSYYKKLLGQTLVKEK